ncbi:MAG: hypothetical protein AB1752_04945 [Candidatus Zixiibacteriota bacterium]
MDFDNPVVIAIALAAIVLTIGIALLRRNREQRVPASSLSVFQSSRGWKNLPIAYLQALTEKFPIPTDAVRFVTLAERTGLRKRVIETYGGVAEFEVPEVQGPSFLSGTIATALSSYGNTVAGEGQFADAREAFEAALRVYPGHFPTWMSMCLLEYCENNWRQAIGWADRVLDYRPDSNSKHPWERATADLLQDKERQKDIGSALGYGPTEAGFEEMFEQAKQIKRDCTDKIQGDARHR